MDRIECSVCGAQSFNDARTKLVCINCYNKLKKNNYVIAIEVLGEYRQECRHNKTRMQFAEWLKKHLK